jgi:hypothetical protein
MFVAGYVSPNIPLCVWWSAESVHLRSRRIDGDALLDNRGKVCASTGQHGRGRYGRSSSVRPGRAEVRADADRGMADQAAESVRK